MKKRFLAVFLALALCLGLAPTAAFAADSDFTIENGVLTKYNGPGGDVVIPDGVTSIGKTAFYNCTSLTSVTIPNSVTSIGYWAFSHCESLTSVTIPSSVTDIGNYAFSGCKSLTSVTIPDGVTSINGAFDGCTSLTSVTIPSSVTDIGNYTFKGCTSLTSVTIPSSVTEIGDSAFYGCTSLTSVTIPEGVTAIGSQAFINCDNLKNVTILEGTVAIEEMAFCDCTALESVLLPDSLSIIGPVAFGNCESLSSIVIPDSVTFIGKGAFKGCSNLTVSYRPLSNNPTTPTDTSRLAATSNNIVTGEYNVISSVVSKSYLYRDNNNVVRVEYFAEPLPHIQIETFSNDFELISSQSINTDILFTEWGGFFAGEDYNFLILGRRNLANNDDVEVIRVLKYDKKWNQQGIASLYGANTTIPFFNSARCTEYNGMLYIHTCHGMYNGHQANMTLAVRQQDMKITDAQYDVGGAYGYVSHSFDQYILTDHEQNIITLDNGDAYPRASILQRYNGKAGNDIFSGYRSIDSVAIQSFPGPTGENWTGAYLGGLAETSAGYITAYNYNGEGYIDDSSKYTIRNMYLSYTSKQNFSSAGTTITQITSYPDTGIESAGKCKVIPVGLDGGYVLWDIQERIPAGTWLDGVWSGSDRFISTGKISYIRYFSDGSISDVSTVTGNLSDCQPILYDSKIIWYVTNDSAPTFYVLDESGLMTYSTASSSPFEDVEDTAYYYDAVAWAVTNGITTGKTATTFAPNENCTHAQILTFLWRAAGSPESSAKPPISMKGNEFYYKAVKWAAEKGMIGANFKPNAACNRAYAVQYIWQAMGKPAPAKANPFTDIPAHWSSAKAAAWAAEKGIAAGTSATRFSPAKICTRGEIVTFLHRAYVPSARLK